MAFIGRTLALVAALVAAVTAAPTIAAPSTAGDDPAPSNGAIEVVGTVLGRFKLEAEVGALYDSNMRRIGDGFSLPPGESKSDWRIAPAVTLSTGLPIGRQRLSLSGTIGRDYYANGSRPDANRYNAFGLFEWKLGSRCAGALDASWSQRQLILSEVSDNAGNVLETYGYGASANCRTSTGIGFGVSVRQQNTRNSEIDRSAFDTNSFVVSPQLSYGSPTLGEFSLSGSYNKASYPNRFVVSPDVGIEEDGIKILSGRFGYRRGLGTKLSFNAGLLYVNVKPDPRTVLVQPTPADPIIAVDRESNSNLGYDFGLSYNSGSRLTAAITMSRTATASVNVGARSQLVQIYAFDIGYKLNRAMTFDTGISFNQRDYRNSFANPNEPLPRLQDKITRVFAGVNYSPVALYSVGVNVSYQDRKSNPDIYSYGSFAAMLNLRVNFGRN